MADYPALYCMAPEGPCACFSSPIVGPLTGRARASRNGTFSETARAPEIPRRLLVILWVRQAPEHEYGTNRPELVIAGLMRDSDEAWSYHRRIRRFKHARGCRQTINLSS